MTVIKAGAVNMIRTPNGNRGGALATPSRGACEVSVIRQRQSPGGVNPPHSHDREEVMIIVAGSVQLTIKENDVHLDAGDTAIIPARAMHKVANAGSEDAEWLLIAPAGVRFFHANGDEAAPLWSK